MPNYIFYDLNARDPEVSSSTAVMLEDTKTVVQSIWRLLTTEEGEIPNFRGYGLDLKRFVQYPMSKDTVEAIHEHVKSKVETYEERGEIIQNEVDANYNNGEIYMTFYIRVKSTGEVAKLPTWTVKVGGS